MIPKIIHYCWYGRNKKSILIENCINSWKKNFPDYEIIEWNETNTDINENEYIRNAYKEKKWAFVSDYTRMKVLYLYGGIYFDTDVEVLKPFPNEILNLPAFTGIESFSKLVSPGLVFACEPGNAVVYQMLNSYRGEVFKNESIEKITTINIRLTLLLEKQGYIRKDQTQVINGITIFASTVFCAYDGNNRMLDIRDDSLCVHHYAGSWLPWYRKIRFKFGTIVRHWKYRYGYKN